MEGFAANFTAEGAGLVGAERLHCGQQAASIPSGLKRILMWSAEGQIAPHPASVDRRHWNLPMVMLLPVPCRGLAGGIGPAPDGSQMKAS